MMKSPKTLQSKGSLRIQTPFFLFLFVSFACSEKRDVINDSAKEGLIQTTIDTVFVEPTQSSQLGTFYLKDDALFYVDNAYGIIEEFSIEGRSKGIKKRELDGPEELQVFRSLFRPRLDLSSVMIGAFINMIPNGSTSESQFFNLLPRSAMRKC